MVVEGEPVILLAPRLGTVDLRCTLAHELGHHAVGLLPRGPLGKRRDEARADRWAQRLVLPDAWLWSRIHLPPYELAEEAGVYQWWVEARLKELLQSHVPTMPRLGFFYT